jgi:CheY-like chemotaxis protein
MPALLLAEDNIFNQKVAATMLKKLGFEVEVAQNGKEVLDKIAAAEYCLIFMDCEMPVLDGYAATKEIRKLEQSSGKHIPVIAMTAHNSDEDRQRCADVGMDDYITKPFKVDTLKEIIAKWQRT